MRYFIILFVLISLIACSQKAPIETGAADTSKVSKKVEEDPLEGGETVPEIMICSTPILIQKPAPKYKEIKKGTSQPIKDFLRCYRLEGEYEDRSLGGLYAHGWSLIQIVKADKGYLYYLDRK